MVQTATAIPSEDKETMADEDLPVPVKSDYTQKPQKPITLKPGIAEERLNAVSWNRPPGEILANAPAQDIAPPPAEEAPVTTTVEWTLHDVSAETRDEAIECARLEGIPVGEWVDRVLRDVLFEPVPEEASDEEYQEAYEEYDEHYVEEGDEGYDPAEAVDETMARAAEVAEPGPVPVTTAPPVAAQASIEVPAPAPDLQLVLQEISDRLSALEQRKGFWNALRSLFSGR